MRIFTLALTLIATTAAAQTTPFDPYDPNDPRHAASWCGQFNPYLGEPRNCLPLTDVAERAMTILAIPEGVVHAPGAEMAYLVVTPVDDAVQNIVVQFIVGGREPIVRYLMAAPKSRLSVEAHRAIEGMTAFSAVVYCEKSCAAALTMRPAGPEFWSRPTVVNAQRVK